MKKPNILLITADQMRWDSLGCSGNGNARTPNIDAMACRGVVFSNAFSPNPICVPARASIMTGNYPHVCTGSKNNSGSIKDGQPLLTEMLKGAGYRAYASGKLHFVPYSPPGSPRLVHGFEDVKLTESGRILRKFDPEGRLRGLEDYFDYLSDAGWHGYTRAHGIGNNDVRPCASPLPAEHYVDSWIAGSAMNQVKRHMENDGGKPFFIWMSSPKPHSPYDPPRPYDNLFDPRDIPLPAGSAEGLECRNPSIELVRMTNALDTISPQAWQVIRSYYYGSVSFLDAMIGRVLNYLEEENLLSNTLVLFTADHGDLLGDFGSAFKSCHLNGSVRVPFIVCGPGVSAGENVSDPVGLQDILPTFAEAAGIGELPEAQGISQWKRVTGKQKDSGREVFYSSTRETPWQSAMVTDGKWKYIYSEANGTEEFYDQMNDPLEEVNLVQDKGYCRQVERYREVMREEALRIGDKNILYGDGFAFSPVCREDIRKMSPGAGSMGWRWY